MATQITVSTDAQDYAPGTWAEITATGVDPGSAVTFQVQHASDPGADGLWGTMDDVTVDLGGDGHHAWSVDDGGVLDLDGAANGSVVTSWYVNPDDSLNWHFLLTAMVTDQQMASTGFTDATGSTSKVYQHWADGDAATQSAAEWNNNILSDNKSDYFEGEVIPHVFVYKASSNEPLVTGQTYAFTVTYNFYQQNTNALGFDYLTTFNGSRSPGQLDATNPAITPTLDSAFTNYGGFTDFGMVSQGIYTVDADITEISSVTTAGSGSLDHLVTITFTYTGATTTDGIAEIYYGLHLASPSDNREGASAWTGGSLQTTVDIDGSGAMSIQLAPAAIIAGSISGVKFNDLNGNGVRDAEEAGIGGVVIYLDLNADGVLSAGDISQITDSTGFYFFSVTPDADKATAINDPYLVREVIPLGWMQTSANPAPMTISAATPTYTNVNFGNQQKIPSLTIIKEVDAASVDAAGRVLNYTITVTNTGDLDLTNVVLSDDFAAATLSSGDTDDDSVLDVGESWIYQASHTVTQGEMNTGGTIVNVARVTTDQTTEQKDDASTSVSQSPSLTIIKEVDKASVDAVGTVLNYTITVTNTGNVDLTNVLLSDEFAMATLSLGDTDDDSVLDVGESWIYQASHTVTQDEMNAGGTIINEVKVSTDQTIEQRDDASTLLQQQPSLHIEKQVSLDGSIWFDADSGTGPVANVGQTIYLRVIVSNSGNVSLSAIDVKDEITAGHGNPLDFTFGSGVQTINLAPGETATSAVVQVQALSGQQTDLATVFTNFAGAQVTAADYANYIGKVPTTALIAPTNTTVGQYLNGSALSFQTYYDVQGGVIQYSTSLKTGKIAQTNPGVFFYFTGAVGSIKVADGKATEQLSVTIDQTVTLKSGSPMTSSLNAVQNNIQLYQVVDANHNGKYDAGETVNTLSSKSYSVTTFNGDITLNFTGKEGSFYLVSVKYDTSSVIGANVGKMAATWPTVNYQFDTVFKAATIETYAGGVDLAPKKPSPMLLEGDQGNGARAVNDAQIKHVINAAICWWEDHGITEEQLSQLSSATVEVADLSHDAQGWWLGASTGSLITIDDDAADHGWSLGLGAVAHNKVDLFSVLVHEMGHMLGKTDDDMGGTLAVGERKLPEISVAPPGGDDDQEVGAPAEHGVPTVDHMLRLVGSAAAEQPMHLHMS